MEVKLNGKIKIINNNSVIGYTCCLNPKEKIENPYALVLYDEFRIPACHVKLDNINELIEEINSLIVDLNKSTISKHIKVIVDDRVDAKREKCIICDRWVKPRNSHLTLGDAKCHEQCIPELRDTLLEYKNHKEDIGIMKL